MVHSESPCCSSCDPPPPVLPWKSTGIPLHDFTSGVGSNPSSSLTVKPPSHVWKQLEAHSASITSCAFETTGKYFATGWYFIFMCGQRTMMRVVCRDTLPFMHVQGLTTQDIHPFSQDHRIGLLAFGMGRPVRPFFSYILTFRSWCVSAHDLTVAWADCFPPAVVSRTVLNASLQGLLKVGFSPNGELLFGCSSDFSIPVWNVSTCRTKHTLTGHTKNVYGAGFSEDSRNLVC